MDPTILLWIIGGLVLVMIGVGIFLSISSQRSAEEQRLGQYVEPDQAAAQAVKPTNSPVTDWLSKRVEKSSWGDRTAKELAQADLKLKPGEYIGAMIGSSVTVGALGYFIGSQSILLGVLGLLFGAFIPRIYIKYLQGRRLQKFDNQLGDMLNLMVNGLRAGYSTMQAMEAISKELPAPICDEFRRVVQEVQLGVSTEKALDNLTRRIPSIDLDLVVTAMKVQREVGGNLAEVLDTISHTIRERVRLKGEIRVLTAQMRFSGGFLSLLPVFVVLGLYVINREYIMTMLDKELNKPLPCGYIGLGLSGLLIIIGYFVMNRLSQIEV